MANVFSVRGSARQLVSVGGSVSISTKSGKELRFMNRSDFPSDGSNTILYVAVDEDKIYRYDQGNSNYVPLSGDAEAIIDDEVVESDLTWSSYKINQVTTAIQETIGTKPDMYTQTTAEWSESGNIRSRANVIYVYSDYYNQNGEQIPAIKIGDGITTINNLPFITDWMISGLVSSVERERWNNKVTAYVSQEGRLMLTSE